jgi:hypothetical protein
MSAEISSPHCRVRTNRISTTTGRILLGSSAKWPQSTIYTGWNFRSAILGHVPCQKVHFKEPMEPNSRWRFLAQTLSDWRIDYMFGKLASSCIWADGRVVKALALGGFRRLFSRKTWGSLKHCLNRQFERAWVRTPLCSSFCSFEGFTALLHALRVEEEVLVRVLVLVCLSRAVLLI